MTLCIIILFLPISAMGNFTRTSRNSIYTKSASQSGQFVSCAVSGIKCKSNHAEKMLNRSYIFGAQKPVLMYFALYTEFRTNMPKLRSPCRKRCTAFTAPDASEFPWFPLLLRVLRFLPKCPRAKSGCPCRPRSLSCRPFPR